jgi:hypothetical protein
MTQLYNGTAETTAAGYWHDYDPENPSDELEDGCWHLLETADGWIETSRYCNQRHWVDCDTAVVKRFARVWL